METVMPNEKKSIELKTSLKQFKINLERYLENSQSEFSRYRSWEHCYAQFQIAYVSKNVDRDTLCLWLAWYLASWGMMHNSKLLDYNYKIHRTIVDIILDIDRADYKVLNNLKCQDWLDDKECCQKKLNDLYHNIRDNYEKLDISGTDTLVTKVLLGTLGCTPAFDSLFKEGISGSDSWHRRIFPSDYITALCDFYVKQKNEINEYDLFFTSLNGKRMPYPPMKVLDMGFWKTKK